MLRVILNRLEAMAEELGRSTVGQISNSRVSIQKHLQHQSDLFHNFMDFKKAFDRVWHKGLWRPQKLQHRVRTGSSHSGTLLELQQCSPLDQSARVS